MKKLVLALIVAVALAPFSAFGLEMMTDSNLKDVTAQGGVQIALDDIVIEQTVGSTAYVDDDGAAYGPAAGVGASLVVGDRHKRMTINALGGPGSMGGVGTLAATKDYADYTASPLIIDLGACALLSGAPVNAGATVLGINIVLPTVEIDVTGDTYTVGIGDTAGENVKNFCTIISKGKTTAILGGHVEIAPN